MKNNQEARQAISTLIAFFLLLSFAVSAFAEGGNGDGTGGGKDKPLALETSSIANGAQNVSLKPEIVLNFNKNVVHFTVRDNNMKCFSMTDEGGGNVPVNVIMGDDQVDPSIKRIVTVTPKSSLEPGTVYLLKISKNLTSKSEVTLGKDLYISFTTQEPKTTVPAPSTTKTASTSASQTSAPKAIPDAGTAVTKSGGKKASGSSFSSEASQPATTAVPVTAGQIHQVTTTRAARTTTTRYYRHSESQPEYETDPVTASQIITEKTRETSSAVPVTNTREETATYSASSETSYSELKFTTDLSFIDYPDDETVSSEITGYSLSPFNDNPVDGPYYEKSENTESSEKQDSGSGQSNVKHYIPYIISGAIAIIAIPAVLVIIKRKKRKEVTK